MRGKLSGVQEYATGLLREGWTMHDVTAHVAGRYGVTYRCAGLAVLKAHADLNAERYRGAHHAT